MSLSEYQRKRNFEHTPEPSGDHQPPYEGPLRFVVHKHQAGRLHYDFRLEVDGVLKSWAIPKGPTLNPDEKRLAVMVEDHPWGYRDFEGSIQPGNYGAGTVMIWDEGSYHVPGSANRQAELEEMLKGLARGRLEFILEGEKLKGIFFLIRTKNGERGNSWLFMKKDDRYASRSIDILDEGSSARSGLDFEGIRAGRVVYQGGKLEAALPAQPTAPNESPVLDLSKFDLHAARRGSMPEGMEPMLATLSDEPFDRPDWLFELKWDGFRAIAEVRRGSADLCSRHNKSYEEEFRPVVTDLASLGFEALLDGEVVVVDEQGRAEFRLLQNYRKTGKGTLVYYVFDLLYLDGYDLRGLPLIERKAILKQVLPDLPRIKYSDHVIEEGVALYRLAVENELEGIIAKDGSSLYRSGVRSQDWLKFKTHQRQEAVIGGWTEPRGARADMGALLLGVYEGKDLVYVGHAGGGFTRTELAEVKKKLQPLARKTSPFKKQPKTNAPATWVEPRLICEVKFSEWTEEGLMRQPIYLGLREDKAPTQVRREKMVPATTALERKKYMARETGKSEIVTVDGHELTLTNARKVYWPEEGITKGDMIAYYRAIAPLLLPHLRDRPLSLHRFPNGIQGKSFFQKDMDQAPDWVHREQVESPSSAEGTVDFVVCNDEATLVWLANLGTIELNPWNSRIGSLEQPDYVVVDLDPLERTFEDVIVAAQSVHAVLEAIDVPHYVKTSGATGLHIDIPLGAQYSYDQALQFILLVDRLVNRLLPDLTSLQRSPKLRVGKIYLDYLQNRAGQTMVAPYSLRPRPGMPVSAPLTWDEVRPGLSPVDFDMRTILERMDRLGDLWAPVIGPGVDMPAALERLQSVWPRLVESHKSEARNTH